jgi:hypothetical protein
MFFGRIDIPVIPYVQTFLPYLGNLLTHTSLFVVQSPPKIDLFSFPIKPVIVSQQWTPHQS